MFSCASVSLTVVLTVSRPPFLYQLEINWEKISLQSNSATNAGRESASQPAKSSNSGRDDLLCAAPFYRV